MVRAVTRSFVAFLLIAGPVLCMSGLVEHACSDCPSQVACGHEEDCDQDPCSEIALRPESSTEGLDDAIAVAATPVIVSHQAAIDAVDLLDRRPLAEPTPSLSLSSGNLPLLI